MPGDLMTQLTELSRRFDGSGRVSFAGHTAGYGLDSATGDDLSRGLRSGAFDTPAISVNGRRHGGGYDAGTLPAAFQLAR